MATQTQQTVRVLQELIGSKKVINCMGITYVSPAQYKLLIMEKGMAYEKLLMSFVYEKCYQAELYEICKKLTNQS